MRKSAGFTLVEILMALAIVAVTVGSLSFAVVRKQTELRFQNTKVQVFSSRQVVYSHFENPLAWDQTFSAAVNTGFECLRTTTTCASGDVPISAILDEQKNIVFSDLENAATGMTFDGVKCTTYPSVACPLKMKVSWQDYCRSCNPRRILVNVEYEQAKVSRLPAFNTDNYNFKMVKALGASGPPSSGKLTFPGPQMVNWVVPAGVTVITIKAWGGGGGGGSGSSREGGIPNQGGSGGAGGFTQCQIPVSAGETLVFYAGGGGGGAWPASGGKNNAGGGGGGFSGVIRTATSEALAIAGGGGGGGAGIEWNMSPPNANGGSGGAGSGNTGLAGMPAFNTAGPGGGGSPMGPGAGGGGGIGGAWGGPYAGGNGATEDAAGEGAGGYPNGGRGGGGNNGGGGGGSGYYGGGGGARWGQFSGGAGGGGGGGFAHGSCVSVQQMTGAGTLPPNAADPDYLATTGVGAIGSVGTADAPAGGHGYLVIIY